MCKQSNLKIRQWILNKIPDIDPPTLHAFAKQLEKLGLSTYNDLERCIREGGVNLTDMKNYVDNAGITRLKAAKMLNEVDQLVSLRPHLS